MIFRWIWLMPKSTEATGKFGKLGKHIEVTGTTPGTNLAETLALKSMTISQKSRFSPPLSAMPAQTNQSRHHLSAGACPQRISLRSSRGSPRHDRLLRLQPGVGQRRSLSRPCKVSQRTRTAFPSLLVTISAAPAAAFRSSPFGLATLASPSVTSKHCRSFFPFPCRPLRRPRLRLRRHSRRATLKPGEIYSNSPNFPHCLLWRLFSTAQHLVQRFSTAKDCRAPLSITKTMPSAGAAGATRLTSLPSRCSTRFPS